MAVDDRKSISIARPANSLNLIEYDNINKKRELMMTLK